MRKVLLISAFLSGAFAAPVFANDKMRDVATYEEWLNLAKNCQSHSICKIIQLVNVEFQGTRFEGVRIDKPGAAEVFFRSQDMEQRGWYLCHYNDLVSASPTITCYPL
ncbi:MAG: hypothetical protein KDJ80_15370 [Nitratireductor sp.]|nr:hypothetical protein [Nitratireductor sp.]